VSKETSVVYYKLTILKHLQLLSVKTVSGQTNTSKTGFTMNASDQFLPKVRGNIIPLTMILSFGLILYACSDALNPVSESDLTQSTSTESDLSGSVSSLESSAIGVNETEPVIIQDFKITFNGNSYDEEANTSTFSYTVTRISSANGFNYMAFEIPDCAADDFAGYSPTSSSSVTDDEIRWTSSIGSGSSRIHTVTYRGKKTTGMIDATIQGSGAGDIETKVIPGPCKGIYTISGFVYVDEDGNGSRSAGEAGIGNVSVTITDLVGGGTGSQVTSADGSFKFNVYTGGDDRDFKLEVPAETPDNVMDNNELLATTYSPTEGAGGIVVTVAYEDVIDKNFGFEPDIQGIIQKFENPDADGAIILNTKPPEYWEYELFFATRGRKTDYTKDELLGFLTEIEQLDLTFTFNFGSDKIKAAKDILSVKLKGGNQSTELEILKSELLAAKLNVVSGNGAVAGPEGFNTDEFNLLILKTGAAAVVALMDTGSGVSQMMSTTTEKSTSVTTSTTTTSDDGSTTLLLTSFNRSGTGGGGVGGD